MSGYILCQTKRAQTPFYIENISTNIYSLEELCYYVYHNLYLVDPSLINENLCRWIESELKLVSLAGKLRSHLGKYADAEDIFYPLFKEINFLSHEELKDLSAKLTVLNGESRLMRLKKKGDALMENGMYVNAIHSYQEVISEAEADLSSTEILEGAEHRKVRQYGYHNLGCAYAHLFQMENALENFRNAFYVEMDLEELKTYLIALKSVRNREEYEKTLEEMMVPQDIREAVSRTMEEFSHVENPSVNQKEIDDILTDLTRDYHRSTGS
ncbi:MAG: hypothetical protein IIY55_07150 [Blautia sp.]|nr:hypothetical protein [Blautia sp.]